MEILKRLRKAREEINNILGSSTFSVASRRSPKQKRIQESSLVIPRFEFLSTNYTWKAFIILHQKHRKVTKPLRNTLFFSLESTRHGKNLKMSFG